MVFQLMPEPLTENKKTKNSWLNGKLMQDIDWGRSTLQGGNVMNAPNM